MVNFGESCRNWDFECNIMASIQRTPVGDYLFSDIYAFVIFYAPDYSDNIQYSPRENFVANGASPYLCKSSAF